MGEVDADRYINKLAREPDATRPIRRGTWSCVHFHFQRKDLKSQLGLLLEL